MEIIAKRIKSLREEHGLTQDQLAKELNISRNAISNYENGVRTPDLNVIRDICEFFNVTLDSFFKEELVYKKAPKTKEIKTILQIILIILLIATSILSIVLFDKSFSRTRAVDDVTKVENSKEISIIKISNKIDKKTYEVEIIDNLKGDGFSFIVIKDNDIDVNISSNYLVFGNRVSKNSQYKNYVSFDVIEIYSPQYIQELSGDALTHPTVNYYKELIEDEPKEDVLISRLIHPRKEEYVISSKNIYDNPYDSFDLNEDFDIPFRDAYYEEYRYIDVIVDINIDNTQVNKELILFRENDDKSYYNLEEYKVIINRYGTNKIKVHYINIDICYFRTNANLYFLSIRYSSNSLFTSLWKNNNLDIKLIYRK